MSASALASTPNFVERVGRLLERVDYRRADTHEDREAIFRLRYEGYLREGAIPPNANRRFTDPYDERDNTWSFGVFIDGKLVSSIRMNVTLPGSSDTPAMHVFPDILKPELEAGKIMVDPTRFVVDRASSRMYPELAFVTLRLPWMACEFFNADYMLVTVRQEHQPVYRRMWNAKEVCPARPYPNLLKPIACMFLYYPESREDVCRRYPFFHSAHFERRMLFDRQIQIAHRTAA